MARNWVDGKDLGLQEITVKYETNYGKLFEEICEEQKGKL